jgi:hypothetical protein
MKRLLNRHLTVERLEKRQLFAAISTLDTTYGKHAASDSHFHAYAGYGLDCCPDIGWDRQTLGTTKAPGTLINLFESLKNTVPSGLGTQSRHYSPSEHVGGSSYNSKLMATSPLEPKTGTHFKRLRDAIGRVDNSATDSFAMSAGWEFTVSGKQHVGVHFAQGNPPANSLDNLYSAVRTALRGSNSALTSSYESSRTNPWTAGDDGNVVKTKNAVLTLNHPWNDPNKSGNNPDFYKGKITKVSEALEYIAKNLDIDLRNGVNADMRYITSEIEFPRREGTDFANRLEFTERLYQGLLSGKVTSGQQQNFRLAPIVNSDSNASFAKLNGQSAYQGSFSPAPSSRAPLSTSSGYGVISLRPGEALTQQNVRNAKLDRHGYAVYQPGLWLNASASDGTIAGDRTSLLSNTSGTRTITFMLSSTAGASAVSNHTVQAVYAFASDVALPSSRDLLGPTSIIKTQDVKVVPKSTPNGVDRAFTLDLQTLGQNRPLAWIYFRVYNSASKSVENLVGITAAFTTPLNTTYAAAPSAAPSRFSTPALGIASSSQSLPSIVSPTQSVNQTVTASPILSATAATRPTVKPTTKAIKTPSSRPMTLAAVDTIFGNELDIVLNPLVQ